MDRALSISSDGLSLYIVSDNPDGYGGEDIWISHRKSIKDPWEKPINAGSEINTLYNEWAPSISIDNKKLYFASDRVDGVGGWDIWYSKRESINTNWEEPVNVGSIINSKKNENNPFIALNDSVLYFSDATGYSPRDGGCGKADLWVSYQNIESNQWDLPLNIGIPVNSQYNEVHPFITSDGLVLFFSSDRPGGYGGRDIWYSKRNSLDEAWIEPVNIGPSINSSYDELELCISNDEKEIYFSSKRSNGNIDIYQQKISSLFDLLD